MGYTNETTHYGIPLPLGSDLTTPMDYNASLQDVDTALFGAVSDCASMDARLDVAEGNISTAQGDITALDGRMTTAEGKISTLEGTSAQHTLDIADVRADSQDMICAYKETDAQSDHAYSTGDYFIYNDVLYKATTSIAVGDTIVPDTNCTTDNVTTELKAIKSDIADLATVTQLCYFDNTESEVTVEISPAMNYRWFLLYFDINGNSYQPTLIPASIFFGRQTLISFEDTDGSSTHWGICTPVDSTHIKGIVKDAGATLVVCGVDYLG